MTRKLMAYVLLILTLFISPLASFARTGEKAVASCVACHGEKGNSIAPTFPKLAGLNKKYLIKQLEDFKLHKRNNPIMEGLAAGLTDQDIDDIATYYAAQTIQRSTEPVDDVEDEDDELTNNTLPHDSQIKIGQSIYLYGDLESQIPACSACHAPDAKGNSLAGFPALKNQHVTYLVSTLKQFREGERRNDSSGMMHMAAKRMTTQQINDVAVYLSELN